MTRMPGPVGLTALLLLLAVPAAALADGEGEGGWRLRVDFAIVDPGGSSNTEIASGTVETSFDTGVGAGVRGEYQFNRRLGIDFGFLSTASVDVSTSSRSGRTVSSVDVSSFSPFLVGLNVHLTPGRRADLYIGPQVARVSYGDIEVESRSGRSSTSVSVDDDTGFGAIVGVDVPVGKRRRWAFQTSLRYLQTSIEREGAGGGADFDPVIFSVGFGYRWNRS